MAKATGKRHAKGASTASQGECPECNRPIPLEEKQWAGFVVCPHCAALAAYDDDGTLRLLKTEEWYAMMVKPEWTNLMEYRATLVERITAPPSP